MSVYLDWDSINWHSCRYARLTIRYDLNGAETLQTIKLYHIMRYLFKYSFLWKTTLPNYGIVLESSISTLPNEWETAQASISYRALQSPKWDSGTSKCRLYFMSTTNTGKSHKCKQGLNLWPMRSCKLHASHSCQGAAEPCCILASYHQIPENKTSNSYLEVSCTEL